MFKRNCNLMLRCADTEGNVVGRHFGIPIQHRTLKRRSRMRDDDSKMESNKRISFALLAHPVTRLV